MPLHFQSIAASLVALATLSSAVGCKLSGRAASNPTAAAAGAVAEATDAGEVEQGVVRTSATTPSARNVAATERKPIESSAAYTISLAAFIPNNHVLAPPIHPQSFAGPASFLNPVPQRIVFSGDDREFDVDAERYRAKQVVTLVPDERFDADGLYDDTKLNLGGRTESFIAKTALADGKLDIVDRVAGKGNDPIRLQRQVPVDTSGMLIDDPQRLGPKRVSVRLHTARSGGPRDRLIAGAPSIDWDFTIIIDSSGPTPKYELAGTWDGYPAMEIYINRQPIYQYRGEDRTPTMSDLLRLMPMYGDLKVDKSGPLSRASLSP